MPALSASASACCRATHGRATCASLENAIAGGLARETTDALRTTSLPPEVVQADTAPSVPLAGTLAAIERRAIEDAVERCGQNVTQAAQLLGIGRATLYRKLNSYRSG